MVTRRRVTGAVVAALGALGAAAGVYLDWSGDRPAQELPLERIYQADVVDEASSYWNSMAVPFVVTGLLGVLGALLLSRFILVLGWLVGAAAIVLWAVMQLTDDELDVGAGDLQTGFWVSAGALIVMLVGVLAMGGRRRGAGDREDVAARDANGDT
ncbi:hypothetical protein CLV30_107220 [Haloactinopolyspora alba]|uniref:Uncharacterized protein n=1 Tax=Haloactinopolyspora alba TaxID=648780 RepID=A0A2P8E2M6_9ACTN|nr:hypothetical protein [Haloactinopolyspora alba]PSL03739.1 hypothetical protein CLV30_107220 [Haloactinopolyspora alba]